MNIINSEADQNLLLLRATDRVESNSEIDNSTRQELNSSRIQFALRSSCSRVKLSKIRMKESINNLNISKNSFRNSY